MASIWRCQTRDAGTVLPRPVLMTVAVMIVCIPWFVATYFRGQSDRACIANLKLVSRALALYTVDYDETFPPVLEGEFRQGHAHTSRRWSSLLLPFVKDQFPRCPLVKLPRRLESRSADPATAGYAYNAELNTVAGDKSHHHLIGRKASELAHPELTVSVYDARAGVVAGKGPDLGSTTSELYGVFPADFMVEILAQVEGGRRHHGGANYAFADGHSEWHYPGDVRRGKESGAANPRFEP